VRNFGDLFLHLCISSLTRGYVQVNSHVLLATLWAHEKPDEGVVETTVKLFD